MIWNSRLPSRSSGTLPVGLYKIRRPLFLLSSGWSSFTHISFPPYITTTHLLSWSLNLLLHFRVLIQHSPNQSFSGIQVDYCRCCHRTYCRSTYWWLIHNTRSHSQSPAPSNGHTSGEHGWVSVLYEHMFNELSFHIQDRILRVPHLMDTHPASLGECQFYMSICSMNHLSITQDRILPHLLMDTHSTSLGD